MNNGELLQAYDRAYAILENTLEKRGVRLGPLWYAPESIFTTEERSTDGTSTMALWLIKHVGEIESEIGFNSPCIQLHIFSSRDSGSIQWSAEVELNEDGHWWAMRYDNLNEGTEDYSGRLPNSVPGSGVRVLSEEEALAEIGQLIDFFQSFHLN